MKDPKTEQDSFSENDILFTCPHCRKNMAIEKRGMGLTIQCPDCQGLVKVPKLSDAELKKMGAKYTRGESGEPDNAEGLRILEEISGRLRTVQEKYARIEEQFNQQQQAVTAIQEEMQHLQEALDSLTKQLSEAAV
jgi:predicted  nucleic acid-binding Zn-ribbon protein